MPAHSRPCAPLAAARRSIARALSASAIAVTTLTATACLPGDILGQGGESGQRHYEPDYSLSPSAHRSSLPCGSSDPEQLCVAIQYVSYAAAVSKNQALSDIGEVNSTWSQCRIEFFVEDFASADPSQKGLAYQPSSIQELGRIRETYGRNDRLLIATTGAWLGQLESEGANAWTVLPSVGPFGVVMESGISSPANLVAHELGHYLNLEHAQDAFNAMNPIIYTNSINLTDAQCVEARATAISFWGATLR